MERSYPEIVGIKISFKFIVNYFSIFSAHRKQFVKFTGLADYNNNFGNLRRIRKGKEREELWRQ